MLYPFFETLTNRMTKSVFCREVSEKYHYSEAQFSTLKTVSDCMQKQLLQDAGKELAGWSWGGLIPLTPVCITLGPGIDSLQEVYLEQGLLSEAYMIEALSAELLLQAYPLWNRLLADRSGMRVRRYHFPGSDESCTLEKLPELLRELQVPVTCNEAYCLLPRKSVVFYAELTSEPGAVCEGICVGCGSLHCPNRLEKAPAPNDGMRRPFTYGYGQIFGLL